jgi:uroporphyrinogen decarboxylase
MMGGFLRALAGEPLAVPPIWMMRQAGRYQRSYHALRTRHTFEALCRTPELSATVALAPVREFDFDAAILFSDLLFPLEALGFGLSYDAGPPALDGRLTPARMAGFRPLADAVRRLEFQREAMAATREALAPDKALIGFVGGPWTLFVYAMEGTHAGALAQAKAAPALYREFAGHVVPLLCENIRLQFDGGADVVMIFDTAAGEVAPAGFEHAIAPDLARLARAFPGRLGYYAKNLHPSHLPGLTAAPWAGVGFDWRWDLAATLAARPTPGFVQGNFDPALLLLGEDDLQAAINVFLAPLRRLDAAARRGWICGLGHGVLPGTPERHVQAFIRAVREAFL